MNELIIKKQKYFQLPDSLAKLEKNPASIEKLSFHYCANSKIVLTDEWSSLKYIEIIGCKYFEFSINIKRTSQIQQIFFSSTEYVDILDISGDLSLFTRWRFENCKYIKFKGQISGKINLRSLEFFTSPYVEIFQKPVELPELLALEFNDGCNFSKIDLAQLHAPQLRKLWLKNSNYVNFKDLGVVEGQLNSFKFENCAFPKLNVDFAKLSKIEGSESHIFNPEINFPMVSFRKVKKIHKQRVRSSKMGNISQDPDIILSNSAQSEEEVIKSANEFIRNQDNQKYDNMETIPDVFLENLMGSFSSNTPPSSTAPILPKNPVYDANSLLNHKFCPECGVKNPSQAIYCSNCGYTFNRG